MDPERLIIARGRTAEVLAWKKEQVVKLFYDWVSTEAIARETKVAWLVSARGCRPRSYSVRSCWMAGMD